MITLKRDQQKMKYALPGQEIVIYQTDINGDIMYYTDDEGNRIPLVSERKIGFSAPKKFQASINNKLDEVLIKEFGIDDSAGFCQIVTAKGLLPLVVGSVIWKKSEVKYKDTEKTEVDEKSSDYIVKGVADEGLNFDLFLLQKNV